VGAVIQRNQGLVFALPALALMATLILYPLVYTGWLSVTTDRGSFVGVENFATMVDDSVTALALRNTAVYVGFSVALQVLLGAAVGILLNQRFRGRAVVRSIVLVTPSSGSSITC
jgi:multiple sugar transport system permease protein